MSKTLEIQINGLDGIIETLKTLPPEIVSRRGGPVKLALAKGARVIRDAARQGAREVTAESRRSTGALAKSIIVSRGKIRGGTKGERYIVWLGKPKRKQYVASKRNVRAGRAGRTYLKEGPQFYGRFIEYGTVKMKARPWLRPAFLAKREAAVAVFRDDLLKRVDKIAQQVLDKHPGPR